MFQDVQGLTVNGVKIGGVQAMEVTRRMPVNKHEHIGFVGAENEHLISYAENARKLARAMMIAGDAGHGIIGEGLLVSNPGLLIPGNLTANWHKEYIELRDLYVNQLQWHGEVAEARALEIVTAMFLAASVDES